MRKIMRYQSGFCSFQIYCWLHVNFGKALLYYRKTLCFQIKGLQSVSQHSLRSKSWRTVTSKWVSMSRETMRALPLKWVLHILDQAVCLWRVIHPWGVVLNSVMDPWPLTPGKTLVYKDFSLSTWLNSVNAALSLFNSIKNKRVVFSVVCVLFITLISILTCTHLNSLLNSYYSTYVNE